MSCQLRISVSIGITNRTPLIRTWLLRESVQAIFHQIWFSLKIRNKGLVSTQLTLRGLTREAESFKPCACMNVFQKQLCSQIGIISGNMISGVYRIMINMYVTFKTHFFQQYHVQRIQVYPYPKTFFFTTNERVCVYLLNHDLNWNDIWKTLILGPRKCTYKRTLGLPKAHPCSVWQQIGRALFLY